MKEMFTIGVITANRFGVLDRVAGVFSRRGYNIESLTVARTEDPIYSRMTIVCEGDAYVCQQVTKQLEKLYDVKKVGLLQQEGSLSREYALLKLKKTPGQTEAAESLTERFSGKKVDCGPDYCTSEFIITSEEMDALVEEAAKIGILELCRSGAICMGQEILMPIQEINERQMRAL